MMPKLPAPPAAAPESPRALVPRMRHIVSTLQQLQEREHTRLRAEMAHVPKFFRLLLRPQNGWMWSRAERRALRARGRRMGRLALYLTSIVVPGTTLTLPLIAWWLDRRDRQTRRPAPITDTTPSG